MNVRIVRLKTVKHRTGLSRSTIYLRMAQGTFPKQVALGHRAVGWVEEEIDAWLTAQIQHHRCCT